MRGKERKITLDPEKWMKWLKLSITKVQDGATCYRDTHGNELMDTHNTGKK